MSGQCLSESVSEAAFQSIVADVSLLLVTSSARLAGHDARALLHPPGALVFLGPPQSPSLSLFNSDTAIFHESALETAVGPQ